MEVSNLNFDTSYLQGKMNDSNLTRRDILDAIDLALPELQQWKADCIDDRVAYRSLQGQLVNGSNSHNLERIMRLCKPDIVAKPRDSLRVEARCAQTAVLMADKLFDRSQTWQDLRRIGKRVKKVAWDFCLALMSTVLLDLTKPGNTSHFRHVLGGAQSDRIPEELSNLSATSKASKGGKDEAVPFAGDGKYHSTEVESLKSKHRLEKQSQELKLKKLEHERNVAVASQQSTLESAREAVDQLQMRESQLVQMLKAYEKLEVQNKEQALTIQRLEAGTASRTVEALDAGVASPEHRLSDSTQSRSIGDLINTLAQSDMALRHELAQVTETLTELRGRHSKLEMECQEHREARDRGLRIEEMVTTRRAAETNRMILRQREAEVKIDELEANVQTLEHGQQVLRESNTRLLYICEKLTEQKEKGLKETDNRNDVWEGVYRPRTQMTALALSIHIANAADKDMEQEIERIKEKIKKDVTNSFKNRERVVRDLKAAQEKCKELEVENEELKRQLSTDSRNDT